MFDRRCRSALDKLQLFVRHRTNLERRDNGEAVALERTGDVLADAAVVGRRACRRTPAAPVYDDVEFFARPQRCGERRDEFAGQGSITANNTQASRRYSSLARLFSDLHQAPCARSSVAKKFWSAATGQWVPKVIPAIAIFIARRPAISRSFSPLSASPWGRSTVGGRSRTHARG